MRPMTPENLLPVFLLAPAADAAGRTSTVYIDVTNARGRIQLHVFVNQGNAATVQIDPVQATAAAGTGSKALSANVDIWSNLDMAADEDFTQRTAAKTYTTDAGLKVKWVVFNIDPAAIDAENGFKFLGVTTGASNAANITSAFILVEPRYAAEVPLTY